MVQLRAWETLFSATSGLCLAEEDGEHLKTLHLTIPVLRVYPVNKYAHPSAPRCVNLVFTNT